MLDDLCNEFGYRVEEFVKCLLCEKIFTNNSYLAAHTRRRHREDGEGERGASKETQTELFYPDLHLKRSESFNDPEEENKPQSLLSVKHRKSKNSLKSNFSSIGRKLNKILKKK